MSRVANRVRDLRNQQQMSLGQLSRRLGVSRLTLRAIETGLYAPSLSLAVRLARTLNHPVEDLFAV
ncbi:helix-turn-helix transcriptional regulator [Brevundimonas sp. PWP3-1b1]|uniref:helix-turn-helix transcriptional regulator n=1 Tax=unclassified Brevundimonas TaxID=2622653 RepID=UPI003CF91408